MNKYRLAKASCPDCETDYRRQQLEKMRNDLTPAMWTALEEQLAEFLFLLDRAFDARKLPEEMERRLPSWETSSVHERYIRYALPQKAFLFTCVLHRLGAQQVEAQEVFRDVMHQSGHPIDDDTLCQIIEWVYSEYPFKGLWEPEAEE